MQSGRSAGKIVLRIDPRDVVQVSMDHPLRNLMRGELMIGGGQKYLQHQPSYCFRDDAAYLIAGGLGGLGRSVARWITGRGPKYLILLSRSGLKTSAAHELLKELDGLGVLVEAPACDVSSAELLSTVVKFSAASIPPIKGCL